MNQLKFNTTGPGIPASHLYAFNVCNSADSFVYKRSFYELKNSILELFGHADGYDMQVIKKSCYGCFGTGLYYRDRSKKCNNCGGTGVFITKNVVLQRFKLNGELFHRPLGELSYDSREVIVFDGYDTHGYAKFKRVPFTGTFTDTIQGIIKHKPGKLNPTWAYLYLLWHYNRVKFYEVVKSEAEISHTRRKHKIRSLLQKYSPLQALHKFYQVKPEHTEAIDDLPF